MMSRKTLATLFIFVTCAAELYAQTNSYNPDRLFTEQELKNDFRCLLDSLTKNHPNLYMYTPKVVFQHFADSLYNGINKPATTTDFYNTITLLNAKICNGHTMFLPGDEATAYYSRHSKFLPFYVKIIRGRLYVNMNCSGDTTIADGSEILSLNGASTKYILQYLLARQIRDGFNTTYPVWILDNYFKEYYGFSFGHPGTFSVAYKNPGCLPKTTQVRALPKDSIKYYQTLKYANRLTTTKVGQGITLEVNNLQGYAVLTVKSFENDRLQLIYRQKFKPTIDSAFVQLQQNKVQRLVLDLRDNQGGDFENGQQLLSYLLRQPFQLLLQGDATAMVQPLSNRFAGKLYVLVNGGSFSNTGIVSARLAYYKRGVFIGEETGGNNSSISGFLNDGQDITLPATHITCAIPNTSFSITDNKPNTGHGTMPQFTVTPSIGDIINNNDTVKKFAIRLALQKGR